jgi:hypothetical protein
MISGQPHTGTFYARIVQISSSYGGSTLNILILWLTDTEKNHFFNGQLYKADMGQKCAKMKKICQIQNKY